jgi:hypothetical protein
MLAVRKNFDFLGVLVLSFVVAVTGGIIRDILVGAVPPAAIASWHTFAIAIRRRRSYLVLLSSFPEPPLRMPCPQCISQRTAQFGERHETAPMTDT